MLSDIINKLKTQTSPNGVSLYDHVTEIIEYVSTKKDCKFSQIKNFEKLSDMLKKDHFLYRKAKSDAQVNQVVEKKGFYNEWVKKSDALLQSKHTGNSTKVENFQNNSRMFKWAGVDFGEEETYRIQKSLTNLSKFANTQTLRFWGKYLCSGQDYYVAEGKTSPQYTDDVPAGTESYGTGCNQLTFWVCHSVLDEWVELPYVTPEQIKQARQINHICTGNLNAKINSYPKFNGLEKHFLKAQLVRITFATLVVPKGIYKPNDDNQIEIEEEVKIPELAELASLENWAHYYPQILNAGRITHLMPDLPEEEAQAKLDELNEQDPEADRLRALTEDKPYGTYETNWQLKQIGDEQVFNLVGKNEGNTDCYAVVCLKSLTWPGMFTLGQTNNFASVYIGYGQKNGQPSFLPSEPQDLINDPEDVDGFREPNPKDPIVEPEVVEGEGEPKEEEEE